MVKCLDCGTENIGGAIYCDNCGSELPEDVSVMVSDDSQPELNFSSIESSHRAKLIRVATGEEIELPDKDEIVIGREDPVSAIFPDIDTTLMGGEEDGVSRNHAKIRREGDTYFVYDLNSVNYTFVNKTKVNPDEPVELTDGDELMLGRMKFNVHLN